MDRIAEAFAWPFRDPGWVGKILLLGVILVIPFVGPVNGLGWMLAALDRLRAGEERLPPANFDHLGRGFGLFVVLLVYSLAVALVASIVYVPAFLILRSQGQGSIDPVLVTLGSGLLLVFFSFVSLAAVALTFAEPAIVLAFDRGGIPGGLRVTEVLRKSTRSLVNTLIAGLMLIAAGLVGQLGSVACLIGVVFTSAYALAMQAWIIRSYEEDADVGRAAAAPGRQ
jgi:Protein of unknown function (DUF4013)